MREIDARIAAIEGDLDHGATYLTEEALRVMGQAGSACQDDHRWRPFVVEAARRLSETHLAMAGLRNATNRMLRRLLELDPPEGRRQALNLCDSLVADLRASSVSAARVAARLAPPNSTMVSCSYSSAVVRVCGMAQEEGKQPRVLIFEPDNGPEAPGRRLAAELAEMGVDASVADAAPGEPVRQAHLAMVGADAMTPQFVVNGTPSLELARRASGRIPFYVVCETVKFTEESAAPPGFDRVPLGLISRIATEKGAIRPEQVPSFIGAG